MRLKVFGFGFAFGITAALFAGGFAYCMMHFGLGAPMVEMLVKIYPAFTLSYVGVGLITIAGFIKGFVFGVIAAFVYNRFA